jgi:hypothetical protein
MATPIPRSARDVFKLGDQVSLMVAGYSPSRRSVDLGVPDVVAVKVAESLQQDTKKKTKKSASAKTAVKKTAVPARKVIAEKVLSKKVVAKKVVTKRAVAKKVVVKKSAAPLVKKTARPATKKVAPVKKSLPKKK